MRNRKKFKNKPLRMDNDLKKDEGLVNPVTSFLKDLTTRTLAVAIWDGIKKLGTLLID